MGKMHLTGVFILILLTAPTHGKFPGRLIPSLNSDYLNQAVNINGRDQTDNLDYGLNSVTIRKMMSGVLLTDEQIKLLYYDSSKAPVAVMKNYTRKWTLSNKNNINLCSKRISFRSSSCSPCCETAFTADVPYTVMYQGRSYKVVQPPEGYQVIFQGICATGTSCSYGTCTEENNYYTWVLIEDPALNYIPPIKFVPIQYSKMCACVNLG